MIELKSHIGQCALLILADKVRDLISYCSYEYEVLRNDEERRHVLYIRNVKRVARLLIQNIDYELTPHLNDKTMEFFKENDDIAESFVAEVIPEYCGSFDEQIAFSDLQFTIVTHQQVLYSQAIKKNLPKKNGTTPNPIIQLIQLFAHDNFFIFCDILHHFLFAGYVFENNGFFVGFKNGNLLFLFFDTSVNLRTLFIQIICN